MFTTRRVLGANPNAFPRFAEENRRANEALVDLIRRYADENDATPAQVALAWILAQTRHMFRSPAPPNSIVSKRISRPPRSTCPPIS